VPDAAHNDERKIVTILFADLVGSTAMGDQQDPERTRLLLERFRAAMREQIEGHGGTVESFMGDGVMAVFGAPAALEDHASRALRASLSMQQRMTELFGERLRMRIGVNSGQVVVGKVREGNSFVTGDPVNVAARLEQAAGAGEILVGVRTATAAGESFRFADPVVVAAKGKPDGVFGRQLLGTAAAAGLRRPTGKAGPALVGRDDELTELRAAYEQVSKSGQPRCVTVVGDPGVGKTSLVAALYDWLGGHNSVPVLLSGRCLAYGRGITYWPLGEVLRAQLGIAESAPAEAVADQLGERWALGLTLGLDLGRELHPFAAKEQLHRAWVDLIQGMTLAAPVVLWIEDIHWAEDLLLELVDRLVADVHGRLLVVTTARADLTERHPQWFAGAGRRRQSTVWLESLSTTDAGALLDRLGGDSLTAAFRSQALDRAEGNPFFLEEIVQSLGGAGGLGSPGATTEPASIPDSVQALLAARIDTLPEGAKSTLYAAAVIGRVFWGEPVSELLGGEAPELRLLEERGFVEGHLGTSALGAEREYWFRHALSRQVAYDSIPKARLARLHAAVAEWMERTVASADEHAALLAYHYAEATLPSDADLAWQGDLARYDALRAKAVAWLLKAAQLATTQYSLDEAVSLLGRALELDPEPSAKVGLLRQLGFVHALKYDGESFWTAMEQATDLSQDQNVRAELLAEMAFEVSARWGMFAVMPSVEVVDDWTAQALELAAPDSRARAQALVAHCYWHPVGAQAQAQESWAIAQGLPDFELKSYAANARSFAAFAGRDYAEARVWAERRLEYADSVSDPDLLADTYGGVMPGCLGLGLFDEARHYCDLHEKVSSRLSTHHQVHAVAYRLELEELAEDWETIRRLRGRAEQAAQDNLDTPCVRNARSLLVCALAEVRLGDDAAARRLTELAASLTMRGAERSYSALHLRLALSSGDLAAAGQWVDAALAPPPAKNWWGLTNASARLDALSALQRWDDVERDAADLLQPDTYLEPFALRALGLARTDAELLRRAQESFAHLGLSGQALQTAALREPRR
jgi:class 3 adenylate cyclase